jgi:hypothetical protein
MSWPEPGPKCRFKLFYTIKCATGLPSLGPAWKLRPDTSNGTVMDRIFSAWNNRVFSTRPEPGPTEKCSGLVADAPSPLWLWCIIVRRTVVRLCWGPNPTSQWVVTRVDVPIQPGELFFFLLLCFLPMAFGSCSLFFLYQWNTHYLVRFILKN